MTASFRNLASDAIDDLALVACYSGLIPPCELEEEPSGDESLRLLGALRRQDRELLLSFHDAALGISVPSRHADRVAEMPAWIGQTLGALAAHIEGPEVDADEIDLLGLPAAQSKLLLRWARFLEERGEPPPGSKANAAVEPTPAGESQAALDAEQLFPGLGGLAEVKRILFENVYLVLRERERAARFGLGLERGILLYGPPGNGKTELARQLAARAGVYFRCLSGSELLSKWVGDSEAKLRKIFEEAKKKAPAILFFDEIDILGPRRERLQNAESGHVHELLSLLDGHNALGDVVVIGATNRLDAIDPALLRPGRFGLCIEVAAPALDEREAILRIHLRSRPGAELLNTKRAARRTAGFSGADLTRVCEQAARRAFLREIRTGESQQVNDADLSAAIDGAKGLHGGWLSWRLWPWRRRTAS